MANVVITTDLQSMLIDFGAYGNNTAPANGTVAIPLRSAFDKDYVKTFDKIMMQSGTEAVRVTMSDSQRYYLTYNTANLDNQVYIVDSVEGIMPTSNDMLLTLLSQTKYVTYLSANISTAATTVVKSGWGVLHAINVTSAVASTNIKVYDGPASGGTLIAEIPFGLTLLASQIAMILDVRFFTSLTVVTNGLSKVQISYK